MKKVTIAMLSTGLLVLVGGLVFFLSVITVSRRGQEFSLGRRNAVTIHKIENLFENDFEAACFKQQREGTLDTELRDPELEKVLVKRDNLRAQLQLTRAQRILLSLQGGCWASGGWTCNTWANNEMYGIRCGDPASDE